VIGHLRQFSVFAGGGGGSVRLKPNILTCNQTFINPFCLYPQIYPQGDAEFQRSVANAGDEPHQQCDQRSQQSTQFIAYRKSYGQPNLSTADTPHSNRGVRFAGICSAKKACLL
jgi:hypothetical protein